MEVFTSVGDLRTFLTLHRKQNKSIGLVPTMGALHQGHLALIQTAIKQSDICVCSIFVNPVQFNNPADLEKYPRTLDLDLRMLEEAGCSAVFAPSVIEMYPEPPIMTLNFGQLETVMEGASRPGHFNGVGIVVSRLFNIVQPDKAFFGQKDLQQVAVIKRLVKDLAFPLTLVTCPTVRETDDLAMSSRNSRLTAEERVVAPFIYEVLSAAKRELQNGIPAPDVLAKARRKFLAHDDFELDYLEMVDSESLQTRTTLGPSGSNALCVATFLGQVRLIDNVVF
jgi:pantoate--beta-alanine ligase